MTWVTLGCTWGFIVVCAPYTWANLGVRLRYACHTLGGTLGGTLGVRLSYTDRQTWLQQEMLHGKYNKQASPWSTGLHHWHL